MALPATFPTHAFATSYDNPKGKGNRSALIDVSSSFVTNTGAPTALIDGSYSVGYTIVDNQTAGYWLFDFHSPVFIDEITWVQSAAAAPGVYRIRVSTDGIEFFVLAENITLGLAPTRAYPLDVLFTTPHRYYVIELVSGQAPGPGYGFSEVEFKIASMQQSVPLPDCDFKVNNSISFSINENEFGDGYSQRNAAGINNTRDTWSASWTNITTAEKDGIINFIRRMKGYRSFKWLAPGETDMKRWTAREPKLTPVDAGYWNVTCTMRQEFDL